MPARTDLKRTLDGYRARVGELRILDLPEQRYLMVDGSGDPNTAAAYADALAALYPAAYAVKAAARRELGRDHVVPPLEGLWWAEDLASFTTARDKTAWRWTLMILVPDWIDAALARAGVATARERGGAEAPPVRVETLVEGRCVQTLHVGPYDAEGPVLARMHDDFMPAHGLRPTGTHHEIYLSDARRTAPERLRTILRQPVASMRGDHAADRH